ncbi:hypothetical protein [Aeromonas hydrophila]
MTFFNGLLRLLGGHTTKQEAPRKPLAPMIAAAVAVSLLAGCDTIEDMAITQHPQAIEIAAGYQVQIDGKPVAIAGTSQCIADTSRHDCIVIAPDTKVVEVQVDAPVAGYPGLPRREAWTVKQVGDQRHLIWGAGSMVIPAN